MKNISLYLLTLILHFALVIHAEGQKTIKGFEIPSKYVSVFLVSDPNCPVQLSGPVKVIRFENKNFSFVYIMQNESNTRVKNFTVENLSWFSNQSLKETYNSKENNFFEPFVKFSSLEDETEFDLINFDQEQFQQADLSEHLPNIWILMVTKVTLEDGSVYDVSSKYKELEKFVEKLELSVKMSSSEINNQKERLYTYVETLMKNK